MPRTHPYMQVVRRLGLTEHTASQMLQSLNEGLHWVQTGKVIHLTDAGLDRLSEIVALPKKTTAEAIEPPETATLHVCRLVRNPKILLCAREKNGPADIRLRVRDATRFRVGMVLESCLHEHDDVFVFTGKIPRSYHI